MTRLASAAGGAGVITATVVVVMAMALTAVTAVAAAVAAAAEENDDQNNEPQAGRVVGSVVKAHGRHLTLCDILCGGTGLVGLAHWKNLSGRE